MSAEHPDRSSPGGTTAAEEPAATDPGVYPGIGLAIGAGVGVAVGFPFGTLGVGLGIALLGGLGLVWGSAKASKAARQRPLSGAPEDDD